MYIGMYVFYAYISIILFLESQFRKKNEKSDR